MNREKKDWSVECGMLTEQGLEQLATFNAEVSRGIVHAPEWLRRMAALQRNFDLAHRTRPNEVQIEAEICGHLGCALPHGHGQIYTFDVTLEAKQ